MTQGGKRKGAGRPATGKTRHIFNVTLKPSTVHKLNQFIPRGKRSKWIEEIILASLP